MFYGRYLMRVPKGDFFYRLGSFVAERRVAGIAPKQMFRGFLILVFLFVAYLVFSGHLSLPYSPGTVSYAGDVSDRVEIDPVFGMEGELMNQLLLAFGSERVANEMLGVMLNCSPRVLKEEIVDDVAYVEVELVCECVTPEDEVNDISFLKGTWRIMLEL
jgi:hypothetical protein